MRIMIVYFFVSFFISLPLFTSSLTLKTITIDGNAADWTEVLANPVQVTIDGDGSSMAPSLCETLSNDRDCPVGTTGRDLNTFAWTYDNNYIYIYQTRYGSSSNSQEFWFYMDIGGDKLLGNNDFILRVSYTGANRSTKVYLYKYLQNGSDPDPMVDSEGYADGYTIIGTLGSLIVNYGTSYGGFSNGTGFETRVPWADLGLQAGTGIYYHVGSSNSTNIPTQIDDNCGGPSGGIGAFGFYLLSIYPDNQGSAQSGSIKEYNHTIENTGTFDAIIDFKVNSSLGLSISIYNSSLTLIGTDSSGDGDFSDSGDYLNPSFDSNSNGFLDTGMLAPDETFDIILKISIPSGINNSIDDTTISGWIEGEDASSSAIDKTYIGDILIYPSYEKIGMPNTTVYFAHSTYHYLLDDYITLKAFQTQNWSLSFYADLDGDENGDILMATDTNGDGDFVDLEDYINPSFDSNSDLFPDTGILSAGNSFYFVLSVSIPSGTPYDTENNINLYAITSSVNNSRQDTTYNTLVVKPRFTFTPEYKATEGNAYYAPANFSTFFPHSIKNNGSSTDIANLSYSSNYGSTLVFWSDPNCDSSISDGSIITNSGTIPSNGGKVCIVAELQIPASVPKGTLITAQITATSQNDPNYSVSVIDEVNISMLVPYEDNIYSKTRTKFSHCNIIYVKGYNFWPSNTYYLNYINPNNIVKKNSTMIANGMGQYSDNYNFANNDLNGLWNITSDDGSTTWDTIQISMEPDGNINSINPLDTNKENYNLTDNVTINLTLNNTNIGSNYKNSSLKEVLLTNDENYYWDGTSFAVYTGNEWTREISSIDVMASSNYNLQNTINNVNFPSAGAYKIKTKWFGSCSYLIAENTVYFLSGAVLKTFTDNTYSVETQNFYLHDPVYLAGNYHYSNTNIKLAFYNSLGNLIKISQTSTNSSGYFNLIEDTSSWTNDGIVNVLTYLSSIAPPPIFTPSDSNILSVWSFNLERLPGLLRNDQYPNLGKSIFKQTYPLDPALDPVNDLEKADFRSLDSFAHETLDLSPSSSYLIFYELDKNINTLRLTKQSGKIVISY